VRLVEHLNRGAPSVHALHDRDAIHHRSCGAVPLGEHQNVVGTEVVDCARVPAYP
jgi:hypothetical protein